MDCNTKALVDDGLDIDSMAAMEIKTLPIAPGLYCPFCRWVDKEAGPRKRVYSFSRVDSLGRHIRVQHLSLGLSVRVLSVLTGNAPHLWEVSCISITTPKVSMGYTSDSQSSISSMYTIHKIIFDRYFTASFYCSPRRLALL